MEVISVRKKPAYAEKAIKYFQAKWASEHLLELYRDCIEASLHTESSLPQWYLLMEKKQIVGCVGLITNDFISRMDLWPWLCALYIEPEYRGKNLANQLIDCCLEECQRSGFTSLYLATDHIGYYEKLGFTYLADGYDLFGGSSRIYQKKLNQSTLF